MHLNDSIVVQSSLRSLQKGRSVYEQRPFALVHHKEVAVAAQLDRSLTTRHLVRRSLQCQVHVDGVVLGGAPEAYLE